MFLNSIIAEFCILCVRVSWCCNPNFKMTNAKVMRRTCKRKLLEVAAISCFIVYLRCNWFIESILNCSVLNQVKNKVYWSFQVFKRTFTWKISSPFVLYSMTILLWFYAARLMIMLFHVLLHEYILYHATLY